MAQRITPITIDELANEIFNRLKFPETNEHKHRINLQTLEALASGFRGVGNHSITADLLDISGALNLLVKNKKIEMLAFGVSGLCSNDPKKLGISFQLINE